MAGRQLDKLRQWAGEVISSREKTELSDEFRQLEMDIELRREGTKRLQAAADVFYHTLSKKKECEALDDPDKLLPIDALGIAQITHGEAYDSAYGSALVTLGRAHCKIATQQDTFAMTFQDTYLKSHSTFLDEIKEYDVQRKKLESRRLSYDAAITKFEKHKNSRKEKAKREVEEEMERAQFRYEETCEDVRAHMHSVQESEVSQLRELTALLDNEIKFVRQWLNVLEDARSDWPSSSIAKSASVSKISSMPRSRRSTISARNPPAPIPAGKKPPTPDSSDDEEPLPLSRRSSTRRRSESRGTDKEEKSSTSKRMNVTGWMGSVTGRSKKKENFSSLHDDGGQPRDSEGTDELVVGVKKSTSHHSLRSWSSSGKAKSAAPSPQPPARILKPPSQQDKKSVRALYDFSGAADELSFKAGDIITVINEVLDDWWMGDLDGRRGLFPTSYTETVVNKPTLSARRREPEPEPEPESEPPGNDAGYDTSDADEARFYSTPAMSTTAARSPFYTDDQHTDTASITSSAAEEEESTGLVSGRPAPSDGGLTPSSSWKALKLANALTSAPAITRRGTTSDGAKRTPPPPPPRRSVSNVSVTPPALPARRPVTHHSSRSSSATSLSGATHGYEVSPFESSLDVGQPQANQCREFKQNPFKPAGFCNNCFEYHS